MLNDRMNKILSEIRELEESVQEELKRREEELRYSVKGEVPFEHEHTMLHKKLSRSLLLYVFRSPLFLRPFRAVVYLLYQVNLASYTTGIAARSEQYCCPINHARKGAASFPLSPIFQLRRC